MLVNVWLVDTFCHFVTKRGMVMQHHEPECHAEKLVQCQGHSKGFYNQNMIISTISPKLLVDLESNLVW